MKRLFQYQAAAEAGVFQGSPYGPIPMEMMPPVMLPPSFPMDKVKPPRVPAKRTASKAKTEKEPKPSNGTASKAQKPITDGTG